MATSATPDQYLETKYVFIDTEAFRRAQFDWTGRGLSKLAQFAKEGHLRLLIADITRREVCAQLQERLAEAANAIRKHDIVLRQLERSSITATLMDPGASSILEEAFTTFLTATKAIDVPTVATIDEIVSDYFARRPPFSEKKKAEFPDAVVIASLRAWCAKRKAKAYVVSGDPDMKACCSSSGPLLHAESIEDIISQATVSKALHDALERTLSENEELSESLADQLRELAVTAAPRLRYSAERALVSAVVQDVADVNVYSANVLERDGYIFTCEIEFEAGLFLKLGIQQGEQIGYGYEDYEPPRVYRTEKSIYRVFNAEVVVTFNPKEPDDIELDSVSVYKHDIELDIDDIRNR